MAYTKTSTPIVYYGGKTAILNHILPIIPEHEVYTEVFFGGGAVFFAKKPAKNETINDKLDLVVNFYQVIKHPVYYVDLKLLVEQSLIIRSIYNRSLKIVRDHVNGITQHPAELAWAFWFQINCSFLHVINSGLRFNNSPSISEPHTLIQRKKRINDYLVDRLEKTHIENRDAINILKLRNVKKAFHYIDPPYPNADQGHYAGYIWSDYKKLLKWLGHECKGKFLLSSYNSRMLDTAIRMFGWQKIEITHRLKAPRKSGSVKVEVLVRNYDNVCGTLSLFDI